jgi:hypothetical protein
VTVYVHAGVPKTGSTAIQVACHRSRAVLAEAGLNYWDIAERHNWPLSLLVGRPPRSPARGARETTPAQVADHLRLARQAPGDLLLSAETVCLFGTQRLATLKTHVGEAVIIAFVREPRAWFSSQIQQRIKAGVTYAEAVGEQTFVRRQLEWLLDAFADVRLRLYRSSGLMETFVAALDRDPALAARLDQTPANRSLSAEAVAAVEALGLNKGERLGGRTVRELQALGGAPFRLDPADLDRLLDRNAEEIAWVSRVLGVDLLAEPGPAPAEPVAPEPDPRLREVLERAAARRERRRRKLARGSAGAG